MAIAIFIAAAIPQKNVRAIEFSQPPLVGAIVRPGACDRAVDMLFHARA
jgi:hypothetical protein